MKKVTLQNYMTDKYYPKIVKAVDNELKSQNFVAPIRLFISMGLLAAQDIDNWRKGRIPYLEKAVKCNLAKAGRILRILRFHAHDLKLKPSVTVYRRETSGERFRYDLANQVRQISKRRIQGILLSWGNQAATTRLIRTVRLTNLDSA